jgi:hypothetical protein
MKRSFLARLRSNGTSYIFSALLLLAGIPAYQSFVMGPTGYTNALTAASAGQQAAYLAWIGEHNLTFLIYRFLLLLAFVLLLSLPFSLFRIIVAQELMGQQEREEDEALAAEDEEDEDEDDETVEDEGNVEDEEDEEESEDEAQGMPAYAWRGKGFAVIAAWSGMIGLVIYIVGTVASTFYLTSIGGGIAPNAALSGTNILLITILAIFTNTVGIGLLSLSTLFFGATIARAGKKLWPSAWVYFGYAALAVAALFSGSAVGVASTPATGQAPLTAPAILLFALWILWLGIMLVRLKPEPIATDA